MAEQSMPAKFVSSSEITLAIFSIAGILFHQRLNSTDGVLGIVARFHVKGFCTVLCKKDDCNLFLRRRRICSIFWLVKSTLHLLFLAFTMFLPGIILVLGGASVCIRIVLFGLAGFGVFCLTFALLNQLYGCPLKDRIHSKSEPECFLKNTDDTEEFDRLNEIEELLNDTRKLILDEMAGYEYPNGKYNINATKLEDLLIENNGKPVRSLIISTFRSGSNFLSAALGSHPGIYYHHEPLIEFGYTQIRGPPVSVKAMKSIKGLFNCDYTGIDNITLFETEYPRVLNRSSIWWRRCNDYRKMCYDLRYLSGHCKLFPFQGMKIVRLRLRTAQELLADENLGVRILLLVRDPRGTVASRKEVYFYDTSPEISDPALLCADLAADYRVAVTLKEKYPNTFRVIRYEDLAADPYKQVEELSKFHGWDFHPKVREYLDTHTQSTSGSAFSTFRNTRVTPYLWRQKLNFSEVEEIQRTCAIAMEYWGYLPAINATHLKEFNPVGDYHLRL